MIQKEFHNLNELRNMDETNRQIVDFFRMRQDYRDDHMHVYWRAMKEKRNNVDA